MNESLATQYIHHVVQPSPVSSSKVSHHPKENPVPTVLTVSGNPGIECLVWDQNSLILSFASLVGGHR